MKLGKALSLWALVFLAGTGRAVGDGAAETIIPAVILKVEGDGIANIRKRSGVLEVAGDRGKVFPGDKVVTDARSAVHLMLNDGSIIKIGFNSEFALEEVENRGRFLSWLFRLTRGSIRALVEKIPMNETHLRVDVAQYREKRREALGRFAVKVANDVLSTGQPRVLEPMNSADRKIVHDALVDMEGIATRSQGQDPHRRVVVALADGDSSSAD